MGLDVSYQAIPAEALVKKVGGIVWLYYKFYGFRGVAAEELERRAEDDELRDYALEAERIRRRHPGIEKRCFDLERRWDMLHYLLSEVRGRELATYDENDWVYRAINGGEAVGENIRMPQGVPINYLAAEEVKKIWLKMADIDVDVFDQHWNPPKMAEEGVYKMHATDGLQLLEMLKEDFVKLREFFLLTAVYNEAVLVFCD